MSVPHVILLLLALLASFVMAIGWAQDPAAPMPWEWAVTKLAEGGLWTGVFLTLLAAAYIGLQRSRAGGKAKGRD